MLDASLVKAAEKTVCKYRLILAFLYIGKGLVLVSHHTTDASRLCHHSALGLA